jgi:hypothetical protein
MPDSIPRPKAGDTLLVHQLPEPFEAPVDHRKGQYAFVAQLRFHVTDDWVSRRHGWVASPGRVLVTPSSPDV